VPPPDIYMVLIIECIWSALMVVSCRSDQAKIHNHWCRGDCKHGVMLVALVPLDIGSC
jgi:hypothetical protein